MSESSNMPSGKFSVFRSLPGKDKRRILTDMFFNNAMYIIIAVAIVFIAKPDIALPVPPLSVVPRGRWRAEKAPF